MNDHPISFPSVLGRRSFATASAASIAAFALPACSALEPPLPASSGSGGGRAILDRPLVDIHAHIFAANDLQGYQFITQVRMDDMDLGPRLSPRIKAFIYALSSAVEKSAPRFGDETKYYSDGSSAWTPGDLKKILQLTFTNLRDRHFKVPGEQRCDPSSEKEIEQIKGGSPGALQSLLQAFSLPDTDEALTRLAASMADLFASEGTLSRLARRMASALEAQFAAVHALLEFLRGFMESRFNRVELWAKFVRGSGERTDAYPRFLVPALVDFGYALDDGRAEPEVLFEEQIKIMSLVARRQAPHRIVHAHVPFNPWRYALQTDAEKKDSLALVRDAIHDCGFLGVKIYPPMGFQAWGNDTIVADQFNVRPHDSACGRGDAFPAKLDAELTKLYEFCRVEDVPIMLHSGATNQARPGWGYRVDPQFWWPVLEKRPGLRVNFAHFGGGGFKANEMMTGPQYMKTITAMMRRYPNIYADLGDYGLVLKGHDDDRNKFTRQLGILTSTYGPDILRDRLMFGTDWMFVAATKESDEFPQRMLEYMVDNIGPAPQGEWRELVTTNYAARNACRFLGFHDPRGKVLPRLKTFYARYGLDRSTLDLFVDIARGTRPTTVARA